MNFVNKAGNGSIYTPLTSTRLTLVRFSTRTRHPHSRHTLRSFVALAGWPEARLGAVSPSGRARLSRRVGGSTSPGVFSILVAEAIRGWLSRRDGLQPGYRGGDLRVQRPARRSRRRRPPRTSCPRHGEDPQPQQFRLPAACRAGHRHYLRPGEQFAGQGAVDRG
jgi:hypothetical protein